MEERIEYLRREIKKAVRRHTVVAAGIEGHSFTSHNNGHGVRELTGVVKNLLFREGIPITVIPPTKLKKSATGDGKATKVDMIAAAKTKGFKECFCDDTADAFHAASFVLDSTIPE